MKRTADRQNMVSLKLQPQPPPQQDPPPPKDGVQDLADAPLAPPFAVAKTESWMLAFLLAHLGQAISCCLFMTIFSKRVSHSSQRYSYLAMPPSPWPFVPSPRL